MKCPVCKTPELASVQLEDGPLAARCDECGGHWIKRRNYDEWIKAHGVTMPEDPFSEVTVELNDTPQAKICPECGRLVLKYKVGHGLDFCVDHCTGCGGVWLDRNEWQALKTRKLHDEIHRVFSTSWQNEIRSSMTRGKMEAIYADRFGASDYEKVKSVWDWLQVNPSRAALMSFLQDDDPYTL